MFTKEFYILEYIIILVVISVIILYRKHLELEREKLELEKEKLKATDTENSIKENNQLMQMLAMLKDYYK